jgi:pSer/pThr/pTyr-binding forkhead associated (FHA) protein
VEDLNSTNGTYLNEKMVSKAELKHQDVITVGKHTLEILMDKLYSIETSREPVNDTMMLTTEKHKEMLKKQKKTKK